MDRNNLREQNYGDISWQFALDRGVLIDLKLTHQDIADTIGSTRVTMTRALNHLRRDGLIS